MRSSFSNENRLFDVFLSRFVKREVNIPGRCRIGGALRVERRRGVFAALFFLFFLFSLFDILQQQYQKKFKFERLLQVSVQFQNSFFK